MECGQIALLIAAIFSFITFLVAILANADGVFAYQSSEIEIKAGMWKVCCNTGGNKMCNNIAS